MSRFLSEAARQLEAELSLAKESIVSLTAASREIAAERDAAREDAAAHEVIVRGLTEERGQLRERIACLSGERDHSILARLQLESRLMRVQAVAIAAGILVEGRTTHSGCNCDECCLRALLAELKEGDL